MSAGWTADASATPWLISNATVQNTDLSANPDFLGEKVCMPGKLRNHRKYSETNFNNSMIFHYQYYSTVFESL